MAADDTTTAEILTDDEVATLNEARTILDTFGKRCTTASWDAPRLEWGKANPADFGRVHALAEAAAHDIFQVLNWTHSHNVRELTEEQLYNRPHGLTVAEPEAAAA